ncbi:MAG: hypothetical protein AB7O97_18940 [Planctomycetota bacterium]
MDRPASDNQGEHFQAAIARHQLHLQTELKRSTSLPSAMFDASDPMLEARLCAATEEIFRCLLEHDQPQSTGEAGEQRLEPVSRPEVAELLVAAVRGEFADQEPPDLAEFLDTELPVLLAETCARSHGQAQERAAELLRGDHPIGPVELDALTGELHLLLGDASAADADARAVADTCRRIAATALRCTAELGDEPA